MKKIILILFLSLTLVGCGIKNEAENYYNATIEDIKAELLEEVKREFKRDVVNDVVNIEDMLTAVVDENARSVIGVSNFQTDPRDSKVKEFGTGSGVIYKKQQGMYYAVTNEHVINDAEEIYAVLETGEYIKAILVGQDKKTDVAVIKFSSREDLKIAKLGNSDNIERGQLVLAIGNPDGYDFFGSVTMGVVSGLTRYISMDTDADGIQDWEANLLQHDAAISPGNSGGALFDINGNVIGINNMKIVKDAVSNIGFAIPSNLVKRITAELEEKGEIIRPFLGISGNDVLAIKQSGSTDIPDSINRGVYVGAIYDGSSVSDSNLKVGDIIVGYNNEQVDTFRELREHLLQSRVSDTITLTVYRNGVELEIQITLKEHPNE
ncbi:S1C family serine protease [Haloplasma contractile]|uniref:Serine protease HtrA protein n=1 Tax=Haloplasma contractile SSD-17B TaxID=1033810 RepID=F7PWZ5_9MOLU|nr:trypsin-like peptidase domain-containing protein [Haloplasma contractile]ERJ12766.1 Serine protease HtrA protein [Haloplasma contractile SSD-17B]